ncbi:MAG: hypothetical protein ACJ8C4_14315 [Gemmataceae bacterium]
MPLFDSVEIEEAEEALPVMTPFEQVVADYRTTGLSLKGHPISFYRGQLEQIKVVRSSQLGELKHGQFVSVAGLVIVRQRPATAKGITFVTLEDETGSANLVIKQATWERYHAVARRSPAWIAHGVLEHKVGVIHVVVQRLEDFSAKLANLRTRSRDFC